MDKNRFPVGGAENGVKGGNWGAPVYAGHKAGQDCEGKLRPLGGVSLGGEGPLETKSALASEKPKRKGVNVV